MQNIFIDFLPPWVETGLQPAFYDKESGTVLQQVARMYAKVNQLVKAFDDLDEATVTTVNEYISKFTELKDYVDNYFDNLDVQEEINNKLDDMAEQGQLADIISQYLNSIAIFCFDNVSDMKDSANLINGSYARTLGYYAKNDGGGALYKIRTITNDDVIDEAFIIEMNDAGNTLVAELIMASAINVDQCGAYGDDSHDDYTRLALILTKAKTLKAKVVFGSSKVYKVSSPLDVSNLYVDFNNCTLKVHGSTDIDALITVNSETYYTTIENGNLVCTHADSGIHIIEGRKCYINNFNITEINDKGIYYQGGYECKINHINLTGDGTSHCTGLYSYGHDSSFNDVVMINCYTGIYNRGFNYYTDIHGWIYGDDNNELYYHSTFINIDTNPFMGNDIYADTYHWLICSETDIAECVINNFYSVTSERVLTIAMLDNEPISLHHGKGASYNARLINIKNAIIMAPSFGINWNTNNSNTAIEYDGVLEGRYPSSADKYLQGIPSSASITLPASLEKSREFIKINMDTVNLNCSYKIKTVAGSYSLTLPFFTQPCQVPVYQCTAWDKAELVGLAYLNNANCNITIDGSATLVTNRFLYLAGTVPRIYRSNA